MNRLSDAALRRLREAVDEPDLAGTRYESVERLGDGGMGVVYRVRDPELGRDAALKLVRTPESGDVAAARLKREAQTLARLEHPGIVPVHDAGTLADGRAFYVMKLIDGERLDVHAARGLNVQAVLGIAERLCETVAFAHARGVVHRDLKPQNVMIGGFGEVLVLDWGVAQTAGSSVDMAPGTIVGTPGWMAPEQAAGLEVDARADVHALGAILHALLSELRESAGGERMPVPKPLRAIADKARATDIAGRYADAGALAADVRAFRAGAPVTAYRESVVEYTLRLARVYRTPIALVLAYILMRALLFRFTGR